MNASYTLSKSEEAAEWEHRYQTRLGCLCGAAEATPEQRSIAGDEADAAMEELKREVQ